MNYRLTRKGSPKVFLSVVQFKKHFSVHPPYYVNVVSYVTRRTETRDKIPTETGAYVTIVAQAIPISEEQSETLHR